MDKYVEQGGKLFLEDFAYKPEKIIQIYNDEDLQAAREEAFASGQSVGFEKGYEEGQASAIHEHENEMASLLKAFNENIDQLIVETKFYNDNYAADLFDTTYAIFKKVLPRYIEDNGKQEVHKFVDQILKKILKKQQISIKVNPSMEESITEFLKSENVDFDHINIFGSNQLDQLECSIEWIDGGASLNIKALNDFMDSLFTDIKKIADEKK